MAARTYDEALRRLLVHEGGYSDHPSDPGGPTKYGITIGDYRRYAKPDATATDVRMMRIDEAKRIYREKYWDAMRCDELPAGVDYAAFDYGVNSGIGRAGKVLRRVLGLDADSSTITTDVIRAARQRNAASFVNAMCDERLRFLRGLRTWPAFGTGWTRRVCEVRAGALAMAGQTPAEDATPDRPVVAQPGAAPGKGSVPINRGAQTTSIGGAGAAGAAAASQANDPGLILAILVLTVAVAIGGWFFWRWWQKRQQEAVA
jgi:lysozyme family protein